MRFLCLDSSAGSAVALVDGDAVVRRHSLDPRRHAETLAPLVSEVLDEAGVRMADLDAVAVGRGPAPFTGLRVGLVTARVLALGAGLPVYGVCSLDVRARLVLDALGSDDVVVCTDARRREVHWSHLRALGEHDVEQCTPPAVGPAADVAAYVAERDGLLVSGPGVELYPEVLAASAATEAEGALDPAVLARLVRARLERDALDELQTAPLYLRRPDVAAAATRKRVS